MTTIYAEPYAGLQAQAMGLAEAAGLSPPIVELVAKFPFSRMPAAMWPDALRATGITAPAEPGLALTVGGVGGAVGAALRRAGHQVVQIQNPRLALKKFDLVIANQHDEITGSNVIIVRTALHRATQARLKAEREIWFPRFAHLPRPLVAALVGGSNGRFRLEQRRRRSSLAREPGLGVMDFDKAGLHRSRRPAARAAAGAQCARQTFRWPRAAPGSGTCRAKTPISACSPAPT